MNKRFLNLISLLLVFSVVFSFVSCNKEETEVPQDTETVTTKGTTQEPVTISKVPTDKAELTEMLNSALDYVELYCYRYTKHTVCKVDSVSVGALSQASNAVDAFKSIFGEKDVAFDYEYNTSRTSFSENFPQSDYSVEDLTIISAEQNDDAIVLVAEFPDENNPTADSGLLNKMTTEYHSVENIKKALSDFSSSASSVSVSASDIKMTAVINAQDSSLTKLEVSYTERYSLSGVTLVKLEGSSVTGTAKTTVTYTDIGV